MPEEDLAPLVARRLHLALGLACFPLNIIVGALRWKVATREFAGRNFPTGFMIKHYWIGLALGWFTPGPRAGTPIG